MAAPVGATAIPLGFDNHQLEYVAGTIPSIVVNSALLTQLMDWSVGSSAQPRVLSATSSSDLFGAVQPTVLSGGNAVLFDTGAGDVIWMLKTGRIERLNYGGWLNYEGAFSLGGDGRLVAFSGAGGRISVWDERSQDTPYQVVITTDAAASIVLSPDGSWLLANESNGGNPVLSVYPCGDCGAFAKVLDLARSHVVRSLTAAERKTYLFSS
jgi:WD40 repeat protein